MNYQHSQHSSQQPREAMPVMPPNTNGTSKKKTTIVFLLGLILGFGSFWLWDGRDAPASSAESMATDEQQKDGGLLKDDTQKNLNSDTPSDAVVVKSQTGGYSVTIARLSLSKNAWVAIHEDMNGALGNILGASRLDAGEHSFVTVDLLRAMEAGKTYYAALRIDDGVAGFDADADVPFIGVSGSQIIESFTTLSPSAGGR